MHRVDLRLPLDQCLELNRCAQEDARQIDDHLRLALDTYFDAGSEVCDQYMRITVRADDGSERSLAASLTDSHIDAIDTAVETYGTSFNTPIRAAIRYYLHQKRLYGQLA